ncbi:MAG: S8 family serine peptidase, partial [candidate division Zixibacteria bacterium]|nr:S8 family serine peptidase [candidate division Zixibacteria bacterium]
MTNCWLLLSESARSENPIYITEKARLRRAKADPETLLIDRRDYRVSPVILDNIRQTGARIRTVSRWLNAVSVEATGRQLQQLARFEPIAEIDLVSTIDITRPDVVPYPKDRVAPTRSEELAYGFSLMQNQFVHSTKLHQAGYTGAGILIALLDTGFKTDLTAFDSTSIVATWDFINNDEAVDESDCPDDPAGWQQNYHGTLVLSAIGAYWPDTLIGIAPRADFALAKTEISCGYTELRVEEDNWIAGAEWADSIGADIISSSLGYTTFDDNSGYTFEDLDGNTAFTTIAADIAASKNIVVITAVGNERLKDWNALVTPSDGDSVLAVGAVSSDSSLASFSSPGPSADGRIKPDITSLGVGVTTVAPDGFLTSASGTSLSTPLVAGGAALALDVDSTLTAAALLDRIRSNGSQADSPDNDFGYGLFDAARSSTLIRIDSIDDIWLQVGQTMQVDIMTSGFSASTLILSVIDLPDWAYFADHSDGTGLLTLYGTTENAIASQIWLTLQVGNYVDTISINVYTTGSMEQLVTVGPN